MLSSLVTTVLGSLLGVASEIHCTHPLRKYSEYSESSAVKWVLLGHRRLADGRCARRRTAVVKSIAVINRTTQFSAF